MLRGAGDDFERRRSRPGGLTEARGRAKTLRRYLAVVRTIRTMSKPVVAMVDGYAVGGAFALVCASDSCARPSARCSCRRSARSASCPRWA
ncbi:MAG: hypothetical protein ACLTMP_00405 [Eggerthella lenta]